MKLVSQPDAPESPDDTKTEIPSEDACLNSESQKSTPAAPDSDSHAPKLMVMICAGTGVVWTRYCASSPTPPLLPVATTSSSFACGAMLPARSTSSVASPWSPSEALPVGGAVSGGPGSTPPNAVGTISVGCGTA